MLPLRCRCLVFRSMAQSALRAWVSINDQYVLNPTQEELKSSKLDLVVAGTEAAVLMVESEAELLSEDQMLGAVVFGHEQQQIVIQNINDLVKEPVNRVGTGSRKRSTKR